MLSPRVYETHILKIDSFSEIWSTLMPTPFRQIHKANKVMCFPQVFCNVAYMPGNHLFHNAKEHSDRAEHCSKGTSRYLACQQGIYKHIENSTITCSSTHPQPQFYQVGFPVCLPLRSEEH